MKLLPILFHCAVYTLTCSSFSALKAETIFHMKIIFLLLQWTVHYLISMGNFKTLLWYSLLTEEFRKFNQEESKVISLRSIVLAAG